MTQTRSTNASIGAPLNFRQGLSRVFWVAFALNSLWTFGWIVVLTGRLVYNPPPRLLVGLATANLSPDLYFGVTVGSVTLVFLSYFVCALLLFLGRSKDRMAWFGAVLLMAFGTAFAEPFAPEFLDIVRSAPLHYLIPFYINDFLAWPLLAAFFVVFPDGIFVPTWTRFVAIYGFFFSLAWETFPGAFVTPSGWPAVVILASTFLLFGASLYAQIYRYQRVATPLQRQQIKWMVYSFALLVPIILTQQLVGSLLQPYTRLTPANSVWWDLTSSIFDLVYALPPLAVGLAILRHRLWDIDLIIRSTLVYSVLTATLGFVYFGGIVLLLQLFALLGSFVDQAAGAASSENIAPARIQTAPIIIVTLATFALFAPLRRRIQEAIDRRFYRRKYDTEKTLAAFNVVVRNEVELDRLTATLLRVVQETVQPVQASVWLGPSSKGNKQTE